MHFDTNQMILQPNRRYFFCSATTVRYLYKRRYVLLYFFSDSLQGMLFNEAIIYLQVLLRRRDKNLWNGLNVFSAKARDRVESYTPINLCHASNYCISIILLQSHAWGNPYL